MVMSCVRIKKYVIPHLDQKIFAAYTFRSRADDHSDAIDPATDSHNTYFL